MSQKYKIIISYSTGNSFDNEDREDDIDYTFPLDIAKKNLEIIKKDYEYYKQKHEYSIVERNSKNIEEPVDYSDTVIDIYLTENKTISISKFWCGYFERLYGARIVLDGKESGMEFTI